MPTEQTRIATSIVAPPEMYTHGETFMQCFLEVTLTTPAEAFPGHPMHDYFMGEHPHHEAPERPLVTENTEPVELLNQKCEQALRSVWVPDQADAETLKQDLLQAARMAVWESGAKSPALIYTIARREMIDELERLQRDYDCLVEPDGDTEYRDHWDETLTAARLQGSGAAIRLYEAIGYLKPRHQRVIRLILEGKSEAEIASDLKTTEGAVEQVRIRAIVQLRKILGATVGKQHSKSTLLMEGENTGIIGDAA